MADYATNLKPTRTMNPYDNTASPASQRYTITDDDIGSVECKDVTDDGEAVDRDDQGALHPIDDSL